MVGRIVGDAVKIVAVATLVGAGIKMGKYIGDEAYKGGKVQIKKGTEPIKKGADRVKDWWNDDNSAKEVIDVEVVAEA